MIQQNYIVVLWITNVLLIGHIYKKICCGISGKLINVIQNLNINYKSCERNVTEMFDTTVSVLQEEILSPLLFSLYLL